MRIAPISNYYTNYNKVSSQYRPQLNTTKAEYSYAEPAFTGKKHPKKQVPKPRDAEKDLKYLRLKKKHDGCMRWGTGLSGSFSNIEESYKKYPNETMELADLKINGQEYELDSTFIRAAAPYWTKHSDKVKDYLTHYGYNEYKYEAPEFNSFILTYLKDPQTMKKFLIMKDENLKYRFSPKGAVALTSNYKDLKEEIDRFVYLKEDNNIKYFSSNGERIVDLAESYKSSPVNAERLLQLRNPDGKIVFYEELLDTYDKYPQEFEEFLQATKTNENLKRFDNLYYYDKLVSAYAKYPDILEEFAKIKKDPENPDDDEYRFSDIGVAKLTEASGEYYKEIMQAINNEQWSKNTSCPDEILNIAKAIKAYSDIIPVLERIRTARKDTSSFGDICTFADVCKENPQAFEHLATIKDSNEKLLTYGGVRLVTPVYLSNPKVHQTIDSNNPFSWGEVLSEVKAAKKVSLE